MERKEISPRKNWQQRLENYGFEYHSLSSEENPISYWNESAYYEFTEEEINRIEFATSQLEAMCLQLVERVIDKNLFDELQITPFAADLICKSWNSFERSIYGRFDLSLGNDSSIKMLEYNADTPTSLFEAAVAQWEWLQEISPENDQFNSIHEKLIDAWSLHKELIHFACLEDSESVVTTSYMEDVAKQAGMSTKFITIKDRVYPLEVCVDKFFLLKDKFYSKIIGLKYQCLKLLNVLLRHFWLFVLQWGFC